MMKLNLPIKPAVWTPSAAIVSENDTEKLRYS